MMPDIDQGLPLPQPYRSAAVVAVVVEVHAAQVPVVDEEIT
jgi:hypothetical protein